MVILLKCEALIWSRAITSSLVSNLAAIEFCPGRAYSRKSRLAIEGSVEIRPRRSSFEIRFLACETLAEWAAREGGP
jgi:hypothetical protein